MLTGKEVSGSFDQHSPETPKIGRNGFAGFIDLNIDLFQRHTVLLHDLRDEEEGWRISSTLDQLIEDKLNIGIRTANLPSGISSKQVDRVRERVRRDIHIVIFGTQEENMALDTAENSMVYDHLGKGNDVNIDKPSMQLTVQLLDKIDEVRRSFKEARAPIVKEINESRNEFYQKFGEFLFSDPSNIISFRDFLTDKDQGHKREAIRPLLVSLARSERRAAREGKPSSLKAANEKWKQELRKNPTAEIIDQFVTSIDPDSELFVWLKFFSIHSRGIIQLVDNKETDYIERISSFLKNIDFNSPLTPLVLKKELDFFVSKKYVTVLDEIRKELEKFHPAESKKSGLHFNFSFPEEPAKRKHTPQADNKTGEEDNREIEPEKKDKRPIGILTREIGKPLGVAYVTDAELEDIIKKEAGQLDSRDSRMEEDLSRMIDNLREDPYGDGTKKLNDRKILVGDQNRVLPLRSLNPGKRMNLQLSHPESAVVRVVYVIYRNEDGLSTIVLEGAYNHDHFNKKFGV